MATTTNYGWTTPDDTALVKDGASAIRTLGSSIDTTLKAQIDAQIPDTLLTTTGDTIYASGASTPARLGIGSTGQVLTVSGGLPTWATPAGALNIASIASGNINSGTSLVISSLTQDYLQLVIKGVTWTTANSTLQFLINGSTSAVYDYYGMYNGTTNSRLLGNNTTAGVLGVTQTFNDANNGYVLTLTNCKSSGFTNWIVNSGNSSGNGGTGGTLAAGIFKTAAQVTSLTINVNNGNAFNGTGTYALYGG